MATSAASIDEAAEQIGSPLIPFRFQLVLVFSLALSAFLILRSPDYLAVDGALRALQVYFLDRPFLHPNNHLLYAVNVYAWTAMLRFLGIAAHDPISFLRLAQAMNGFAAAACLTIVYGLLYRLTNRWSVAGLASVGLGASSAFLAHATNSAEPMVGLLWSELSVALAIYGSSRAKKWPLALAGLFLALAMATYQSMVLFGVPIVLMLGLWARLDVGGISIWQTRLFSVGRFVLGFAFGIPLVYGTAYYLSGTRTFSGMIIRYLHLDGSSQVYGGASLVKLASVLPGLAVSLFPCLPQECGFRCLVDRRNLLWVPIAGLAIALASIFAIALAFLARQLWSSMAASEKLAISCSAAGFLTTMFPVIFWMPTYDKLWLQPLVCLFVSGGLLVGVAIREPDYRYLRWAGCALVAAIAVSNLSWAAWTKVKPTPYLDEARQVSDLVTPQDLVVGDWNNVFLLYQAFWAPRANSFNVPTLAERDGLQTVSKMMGTVRQVKKAGGQVYFLGILDLSPQEWKTALGDKRGIPYEEFQEYRSTAETIKFFSTRSRSITLRRLPQ